MCASVVEALQEHLGLSLTDPRVVILDPCTGTGDSVVNLMRRMPKRDLKRMYKKQLFANEVMLLPYYIAAQNIEHTYTKLTGEYEPFHATASSTRSISPKAVRASSSLRKTQNASAPRKTRQSPS